MSKSWLTVREDGVVIASRCDWMYKHPDGVKADPDGEGWERDETRYRLISGRDGDIIVSNLNSECHVDIADLRIMLATWDHLAAYKQGARAMFDYLQSCVANHFHGNPKLNEICKAENEVFTAWMEDGLENISIEDFVEYKSIYAMYDLGLKNGWARASTNKKLNDATKERLRVVCDSYFDDSTSYGGELLAKILKAVEGEDE